MTDAVVFRPEPALVEKAHASAEVFFQIGDTVETTVLARYSFFIPELIEESLLVVISFVTNASEHDALRLAGERVMAVEMEGAAVAQVCQEHKIPYVVVRTISDKADHSAEVDFKAFVF